MHVQRSECTCCRAGLDVFEDEPDTKPGLLDCDNVVAVPHIASASFWTRAGMVSACGQCTRRRRTCLCCVAFLLTALPLIYTSIGKA